MNSAAANLAERLRGAVSDQRVLAAIADVPRELFVPAPQGAQAYANVALPIECGQTISQPVVVARMLELLRLAGGERVLDVGTGSGYHAALLGRLAGHVYSIERHPELTERARRALAAAGIDNVTLVVGDGAAGLAEHAPFDAINVAAAVGEDVPAALLDQLGPAGRLVAPVGQPEQHLMVIARSGERLEQRRCEPVRFVPLVRGLPRPS